MSILFNLCSLYGYVPDALHHATIIPLVKCKTGDFTDVNNYRAIALSNSVSKILETLLFNYVESQHAADEYQFGFKKVILQLYVQMFLKRQLITTERMAVMFLLVLLISTRHLIT